MCSDYDMICAYFGLKNKNILLFTMSVKKWCDRFLGNHSIIKTKHILNVYLQAPSLEKYYPPKCGIEFGLENVRKRAKIVRALYGGNTSGRDFRNHLRSCVVHVGYQSCKADPDIWMCQSVRSDGTLYYQYALLYVDDVLVVAENAEGIIRNEIGKYF